MTTYPINLILHECKTGLDIEIPKGQVPGIKSSMRFKGSPKNFDYIIRMVGGIVARDIEQLEGRPVFYEVPDERAVETMKKDGSGTILFKVAA